VAVFAVKDLGCIQEAKKVEHGYQKQQDDDDDGLSFIRSTRQLSLWKPSMRSVEFTQVNVPS
jgi:hypothetical protein